MNDVSFLTGLSFYTVSRYHYIESEVCDFRDSPRPHYCMGLILSGWGTFEFDGTNVDVHKGDIIFVPVGSRYRSIWTGSPDITYISMHFFFLNAPPFPQDKTLKIQKLVPEYENEFENYFTDAYKNFSGETAGQLSAIADFYGVMGKILPRMVFGETRKRDERIVKAARYLEEHYSEKISASFLASLCHMGSSQFHVCFKNTFGMTPIEYKNRICIRYAILKLLKGNESVEEISDSLGFESATYFRRVFRKITGCVPTKYAERQNGI